MISTEEQPGHNDNKKLIMELFGDGSEYENMGIGKILLSKISKYERFWEVLKDIGTHIINIVEEYPQFAQRNEKTIGNVQFQGDNIYIGSGTTIEHGAFIKGPCLIGKNCQIRKGAYIRGNAIIGDSALIGNSSEVKNSILLEKCQVAHFNYIGDSILGYEAHFAAGSITSNLKLDSSEIKIKMSEESQPVKTGMIKIGGLIGNGAWVGCNAILNPGSVIGMNSAVYPLVNFRGYMGKQKICKLIQSQQIVEKK